jgi:hypothetical protein
MNFVRAAALWRTRGVDDTHPNLELDAPRGHC